jgi:glycosyltransferase involved in cell wall biosynthesis
MLCAVDLDTIIPNVIASKIKNRPLIYDAHEFFTEVPELTNRRLEKFIWNCVEKICIPQCNKMYTVGDGIAELFRAKYHRECEVIYNYPNSKPIKARIVKEKPIIIYQGDLNEGRGLREAIEAMTGISDAELWILGDGYERNDLEELSRHHGVTDRVKFLGYILPADIDGYTSQAYLGLNLFENKGLNYYYSLANKFFDYIQNRVPVLSMNFPEYRRINEQYNIAILIDNIDAMTIQAAINSILNDKMKYNELVKNCDIALRFLNWEVQEEKLRSIYHDVE